MADCIQTRDMHVLILQCSDFQPKWNPIPIHRQCRLLMRHIYNVINILTKIFPQAPFFFSILFQARDKRNLLPLLSFSIISSLLYLSKLNVGMYVACISVTEKRYKPHMPTPINPTTHLSSNPFPIRTEISLLHPTFPLNPN